MDELLSYIQKEYTVDSPKQTKKQKKELTKLLDQVLLALTTMVDKSNLKLDTIAIKSLPQTLINNMSKEERDTSNDL